MSSYTLRLRSARFFRQGPDTLRARLPSEREVASLMGSCQQAGANSCGSHVALDLDVSVGKNLGIDVKASWGHLDHYVTKHTNPLKQCAAIQTMRCLS